MSEQVDRGPEAVDGDGLIEARLVQTDVTAVPLMDNRRLVTSAEIDPSSILVQVLRRPTEPINKTLQDCLYAWIETGIAHMPLEDAFGGWIDVTRNWQTLLFRADKRFRYLMLIDADVGPPVNAPLLLARHDKPLVSALVPAYNAKRGLFLCIAVKGTNGKAHFPTLTLGGKANGAGEMPHSCIPRSGIIRIHNAGAGCLMIRRDVLERLWEIFEEERKTLARCRQVDQAAFESALSGAPLSLSDELLSALKWRIRKANYEEDMTGAPFSIPESVRNKAADIGVMPKGEDICFTDRVREAGFEMYADFEVLCIHDKLMRLSWPKDAIDPHLSPEDFASMAWDLPVVQGA